jgi:transposase InsO family protein
MRDLIHRMCEGNPLWGAPRIHGELLKLGFNVAQSTVSKYMRRRRGPPSQGWKTFLRNHAEGIASVDFLVVPTLTFQRLFAFVILGLGRRRVLWIGVTTNPTAEWLARQLTEAFPWDTAPTFLIRDNDGSYGEVFTRRLRAMGIRDRPTAPRSPWQNCYVERVIGSIRRECLDHMIVLGEVHLRRVLSAYVEYFNAARTHLAIAQRYPRSQADREMRRHNRCSGARGITSPLCPGIVFGRDTPSWPPRTSRQRPTRMHFDIPAGSSPAT